MRSVALLVKSAFPKYLKSNTAISRSFRSVPYLRNQTESAPQEQGATEVKNEDVNHEKRIEELQDQIKDLQDRLLRSYAEEENVRRIARKDVEDAKAYANTSFAKSLLDVADNLDRALSFVTEDKMNGEHAASTLKSLVEGVRMTNNELVKVFGKFHIKSYGASGDKFDPNIHDALFRIPVEANSDKIGTIGQVVKTGYMMKDRVIRAAEVGTFVKQE